MSFSEAELAAPRIAALRIIRRRRVMWRSAMAAAAALLPFLFLLREPKVEMLALRVPAPAIQPGVSSVPVASVVRKHKQPRPVSGREKSDKPVVVKMFTDDPNVVIYWISD